MVPAPRDAALRSFPLAGLGIRGLWWELMAGQVGAGWPLVSPWRGGTRAEVLVVLPADMHRALAASVGFPGLKGSDALWKQIVPSAKDPTEA